MNAVRVLSIKMKLAVYSRISVGDVAGIRPANQAAASRRFLEILE